MNKKYWFATLGVFFIMFILSAITFADTTPGPIIRAPNVPMFLEPYRFTTVRMNIFTPELAEMQPGFFSRLLLNPAAITDLEHSRFYIDLYQTKRTPFYPLVFPGYPPPGYDYSSYAFQNITDEYIAPRWLSNTTLSGMDSQPLYNAAWLINLSPRLHLGLFNRLALDYGPYLTASNTRYWDNYYGQLYTGAYGEIAPEPSTLVLDENQQHMVNIQSQAILGYTLSSSLRLGLQVSQNRYTNKGDIFDSIWKEYPHSKITNLNDDHLDIDGSTYEIGAGVQFRPNPNLTWGISGKLGFSSGKERRALLDTTYSRFEQASDSTYFNTQYFYSRQRNDFSRDGTSQAFTLHGEKQLSPDFTISSALSVRWKTGDLTGSVAAQDTAYWDRIYDTWDNDYEAYYKQYDQYWSQHEYDVHGDGTQKWSHQSWFLSGEYHPAGSWGSFLGIYLVREYYNRTITETKNLQGEYWYRRTLHFNGTGYDLSEYSQNYSLVQKGTEWRAIIPLGGEIRLIEGLKLIVGSELHLAISDSKESVDILYPRKYSKEIRNGATSYEVLEENRYEVYRNDPPRELNRSTQNVAGIVYQPSEHLTIQVKLQGAFFSPSSWVFGFQWE